MIETEFALLTSARGTFNVSGVARSTLAVVHYRWLVKRMATTSAGPINEPTLSVYRGSEQPSARVDYTRRGIDTSETNLDLRQGELLMFVWEGGTPGTQAIVNVEGSYFIQGKRAY